MLGIGKAYEVTDPDRQLPPSGAAARRGHGSELVIAVRLEQLIGRWLRLSA